MQKRFSSRDSITSDFEVRSEFGSVLKVKVHGLDQVWSTCGICATSAMGNLCVALFRLEHKAKQQTRQGVQTRKQKAAKQVRQRKGIRVTPREGVGLICGMSA